MQLILRKTRKTVESIYHVLYVLFQDILRLKLSKEAAALTYSTILAFVPSLIVVFSVLSILASYYGQIAYLNNVIKDFLFSFLTLSTATEIHAMLEKFLSFADLKTIGLSGLLGFSVTFFFLLETIELSFNEVWGIKQQRNFFVRIFRFSLFFIGASVLLSVIGGSVFQFLQVVQGLDSSGFLQSLLTGHLSQYILYFIVLTLGYSLIPNCPIHLKNALLGAFVTTVLFFFMIKVFAIFVAYGQTTRLVYSGMASLPLFIFWVFLCWIVVLLGVVVSWRAQYGIWTEAIYENDPFRNQELERERLKSFLPLLILLVLYYERKGISVENLQKKLKVSYEWIRTALIKLQEKSYLIHSIEELELNDLFLRELQIKPIDSLEKIKLAKITKDFLRTTEDWIAAWDNNINPEIFLAFHRIVTGGVKTLDLEVNLKDIMPIKKKV